jgi:hypothetical protein
MRQVILTLVLLLPKLVLADPMNFYKSDAKTGEFERTRYACMQQSLQPSGEVAVWLFVACMKAQGWYFVEQPSTPAAD